MSNIVKLMYNIGFLVKLASKKTKIHTLNPNGG
jgi:hypothetical protein